MKNIIKNSFDALEIDIKKAISVITKVVEIENN